LIAASRRGVDSARATSDVRFQHVLFFFPRSVAQLAILATFWASCNKRVHWSRERHGEARGAKERGWSTRLCSRGHNGEQEQATFLLPAGVRKCGRVGHGGKGVSPSDHGRSRTVGVTPSVQDLLSPGTVGTTPSDQSEPRTVGDIAPGSTGVRRTSKKNNNKRRRRARKNSFSGFSRRGSRQCCAFCLSCDWV
jgi:hypothetical protein